MWMERSKVIKEISLGEYLKEVRLKQGKSLRMVSCMLKLSAQGLCNLEHDAVKRPDKETIRELAKLYREDYKTLVNLIIKDSGEELKEYYEV